VEIMLFHFDLMAKRHRPSLKNFQENLADAGEFARQARNREYKHN
jgi:hypothetical protein